jgi:hypothetical protein
MSKTLAPNVFHVPAVAMQLTLTLLKVENVICASLIDVLTKRTA